MDTDAKEYIDAIEKQLCILKEQHPEWNEAIDKIYKALYILEDNFDRCYLGIIQNSNMLEGFISDVSRTQDYDPKITYQLKTILDYYKKKNTEKGNRSQNE